MSETSSAWTCRTYTKKTRQREEDKQTVSNRGRNRCRIIDHHLTRTNFAFGYSFASSAKTRSSCLQGCDQGAQKYTATCQNNIYAMMSQADVALSGSKYTNRITKIALQRQWKTTRTDGELCTIFSKSATDTTSSILTSIVEC